MAVTDVTPRGAGVLAACEAQGHHAEPIQTTAGTGDPDPQLSGWRLRVSSPITNLARLALVLAAGGLPLDTPGALLIRAVADGAFIDLHLSAGRDHRCVRVTVRPCTHRRERLHQTEKKACQRECILWFWVAGIKPKTCVEWPHVKCMMFSS